MINSQCIRLLAKATKNKLDAKEHSINCLRLLRQSKKLSQLIAFSWTEKNDQAKKIRKIFLNFNNSNNRAQTYKDMEDLLSGDKPDLFDQIFSKEEIKSFQIRVDWDSFEGGFEDNLLNLGTGNNQVRFFVLRLPYPPIPNKENLDLQDEKLTKWLNEKIDVDNEDQDINNPFPPIPYLPLTSC